MNRDRYKRFFNILAIAAGAGAIMPASRYQLRLGFSWRTKPDYVFFYFANERGLYAREGLEVSFLEGAGAPAALQSLEDGALDLLVMPCTFALAAIDAGAEIVILARYQEAAPVCLISRAERPVTRPRDLEGKRIAQLSGETGTAFLATFCEINAVDYDKILRVDVPAADKIGAFLRNEVDIVSVYRTNELHVLKSVAPFPLQELDIASFGLKLPGMCVVAAKTAARIQPDLFKSFLMATDRAIGEALDAPLELAGIAREMPGAHPAPLIVQAQLRELMQTIERRG